MFTTKEGNLIISSLIICFTNAREYAQELLGRLTFKYFQKVERVFYTIALYGVILSLVLDKVFL